MTVNAATRTSAPAPRAAATAKAVAPAPAANAAARDQLQLTAKAQAPVMTQPLKRPPSTWLGIASGGAAVGLAAFGVGTLTGAWLPVLGVAAALGGVLALCGVGLTQGWGEGTAPRPFDPAKADWSPMAIMTRVAGAIGMGGAMVATALGTGAVAMSAGPVAVFAWPAAVVATALVGVLAWGVLKQPNPLQRS